MRVDTGAQVIGRLQSAVSARGIAESLYLRDPDGIGIELLSDELMWFGGRWLDR